MWCALCDKDFLSPDTTMKATVMSVLLCLLTVLVEAQSVTYPFMSFMGTNISNHSFINFTLVGNDASSSVQCHTAQRHNRGWWHFPHGPLVTTQAVYDGLFQICEAKRCDLRRRGSSVTNGVYRCVVDTSATDMETIFVGLYASGGQYILGLSIYVSVMSLCIDACVQYWHFML